MPHLSILLIFLDLTASILEVSVIFIELRRHSDLVIDKEGPSLASHGQRYAEVPDIVVHLSLNASITRQSDVAVRLFL